MLNDPHHCGTLAPATSASANDAGLSDLIHAAIWISGGEEAASGDGEYPALDRAYLVPSTAQRLTAEPWNLIRT